MANLKLSANLERADDFYAALLAAHEDLSEAETHALNARLVLLLANHIGSHEILIQALGAATTIPKGTGQLSADAGTTTDKEVVS